MSISDWGSIGEIVSGIGVILSLIYVGVQVRKNSQDVRDNTAQQILNLFVTINHSPDELLLAAFLKLYRDEPFDKHEQMRYSFYLREQLETYHSAYYHYKRGNLDQSLFRAVEQRIKNNSQFPQWREVWEIANNVYSREFRDYVNGLLQENA